MRRKSGEVANAKGNLVSRLAVVWLWVRKPAYLSRNCFTAATVRAGSSSSGSMSQILENHQRAPGNIAMKTLGVFWRNEAIPATPDDESGELQFGNAMRQAHRRAIDESDRGKRGDCPRAGSTRSNDPPSQQSPCSDRPKRRENLARQGSAAEYSRRANPSRECSRDENRSAARLASLGSLLRRPE